MNRKSIYRVLVGGLIVIAASVGWNYFATSNDSPTQFETATVTGNASSSWQTYRSDYGFQIQYPPDWKIISENAGWTVSFGTGTSGDRGYDGEFFVFVYDKKSRGVERYIADMGSQFVDRKEKRENITVDGIPAVKVTVTTPSVSTWSYEVVIVEQSNLFYVISNGAIINELFSDFYRSFKFTTASKNSVSIQLLELSSPGTTQLPIVKYRVTGATGAGYISIVNKSSGELVSGAGGEIVLEDKLQTLDFNALNFNGHPIQITSGDYFLRVQDKFSDHESTTVATGCAPASSCTADSAVFHIAPGAAGL